MNYYVYSHIDPDTEEIIYIGHGWKHRAWLMDEPFRSREHADYLAYLHEAGYNPFDWVHIEDQGLGKGEACELERGLIKHYKPRFNKIQGAKLLKVSPEILKEAFDLRNSGWTFKQIAENFDLSTMTIHRAMNGKCPALEELLERQ